MASDCKPGSLFCNENPKSIALWAIRVCTLAEAFCIVESEVIPLAVLAYGDLGMPRQPRPDLGLEATVDIMCLLRGILRCFGIECGGEI
jgi:hypothetical protein